MTRTASTACLVLLCRGCCCGTREKHPDTDHDAQRRALEAAAQESGARVVVAGCLNACERSNVVALRYSTEDGAATLWLGRILRARQTEALCAWLRAGGPARAPLPAALALAAFSPSEESSACALRAGR